MTVKITDVHSLPVCPSASTLRSLPPSQQATVLNHVSSTLQHALSLPDDKLSKLSCSDFILSYARDDATTALNSLVFFEERAIVDRRTLTEKLIRKRVLSLAQRLAALPRAGGLTLQILLDLCIVYGPKNSAKVNSLVETAVQSDPALLHDLQSSAAPSFALLLLSPDSGLHALRKTLFYLKCLLQAASFAVLDIFVQSKDFVLALAKCYDTRLSAIAAGYGGIHIERADETETTALWLECKVALIDCFHVLLEHVLKGVRSDPHSHSERAFDLVFSLLNLPSTSGQTPFLNRSLLADYQEAYVLSSTLAAVLANSDDPRLDVLEATLKSFETDGSDKLGAIKVLLRSSGIAPGIDHRGAIAGSSKGKARATPGVDFDAAVSSVLDILPDQEPAYVHSLLALPEYAGDAERVISALLEGDAPAPAAMKLDPGSVEVLPERRNIFNEQLVEPASVNVGKRHGDAEDMLQDRTFLDQMKADILRRAEELSESDEEEGAVAFEDELDGELGGKVRLAGDGEDSDEDVSADEIEDVAPTPETHCELAYISNQKVFERDADTRRSKARADLKAQTGWSDEQIEGWRIMLERNPKKDKILQKHEFAGNRFNADLPVAGSSSSRQHEGGGQPGRGGRGRGRGRGGRGRGGGGSGSGTGGGDARERAWKDKNKSRQANHNRKRGHDRKMARGGAIPGPSS